MIKSEHDKYQKMDIYQKAMYDCKHSGLLKKLFENKTIEINGYEKNSLINSLDWLLGGKSISEGKFIPPYRINNYTVCHKIGVVWIITIS